MSVFLEESKKGLKLIETLIEQYTVVFGLAEDKSTPTTPLNELNSEFNEKLRRSSVFLAANLLRKQQSLLSAAATDRKATLEEEEDSDELEVSTSTVTSSQLTPSSDGVSASLIRKPLVALPASPSSPSVNEVVSPRRNAIKITKTQESIELAAESRRPTVVLSGSHQQEAMQRTREHGQTTSTNARSSPVSNGTTSRINRNAVQMPPLYPIPKGEPDSTADPIQRVSNGMASRGNPPVSPRVSRGGPVPQSAAANQSPGLKMMIPSPQVVNDRPIRGRGVTAPPPTSKSPSLYGVQSSTSASGSSSALASPPLFSSTVSQAPSSPSIPASIAASATTPTTSSPSQTATVESNGNSSAQYLRRRGSFRIKLQVNSNPSSISSDIAKTINMQAEVSPDDVNALAELLMQGKISDAGQFYSSRQQSVTVTRTFDAVYKGDKKDGVPHGYGRYEYSNGWYVGHFVNGERHGSGEQHYSNGDVYIGEFFQGQVCFL